MGQLVARAREEQSLGSEVSITYAGRLDPAASGLVLLLTGNEVHQKDQLLSCDKKYEVEVLLGVATDTYDLLGVPLSVIDPEGLDLGNLKEDIVKMIGGWSQPYPPYSSRPVAGKPLWEWARAGQLDSIEIPIKNVELYNISVIKEGEYTTAELVVRVQKLVSQISGDFRQEEIIAAWKDSLAGRGSTRWPYLRLRVVASSGTYMRSLAVRIGLSAGLPAVASEIVRTHIGEYTKNS